MPMKCHFFPFAERPLSFGRCINLRLKSRSILLSDFHDWKGRLIHCTPKKYAIVVSSRDKLFPRTSLSLHIKFLDARCSILDPRSSILASRNSNVSTFETRESSFEDRVETVNLLLSGTVCIHPEEC